MAKHKKFSYTAQDTQKTTHERQELRCPMAAKKNGLCLLTLTPCIGILNKSVYIQRKQKKINKNENILFSMKIKGLLCNLKIYQIIRALLLATRRMRAEGRGLHATAARKPTQKGRNSFSHFHKTEP
jgi:hypothetical protein